ncbi:MAG: bifunctional folylpolyglutamate synthase/dihydrofolate synthase [Synergistaceae bacterium]|jgi:dihydrofolate synthase/folylpolyglutamate synthase|nr:bifunctional folylpolyglutamate synthase/dihydrofolate synthase [Synergistaceae bacterium]
MDNNKAIEYITSRDWRGSRLGLERMGKLLALLDNSHRKLKYVHVAGTNGKGSVCVMLARVLTEAGYKTGLYTSPYINRFHERIQIDGEPIRNESLISLAEKVRRAAEQMDDHPTEFEMITAIGFEYFHESACDIVVLEVGLGGRLDATNIIPAPEVAIITPISLDHTEQLGGTVDKIAAEKAGVIKSDGPVISSPQAPDAEKELRRAALSQGVGIEFVNPSDITVSENSLNGQIFSFKGLTDLKISLLGAYQPENAAAVILAAERLREAGWRISDAAIYKGLADARWPARFEIVHRNPSVIVEGGHNPKCAECLSDNLRAYFPDKQVSFVIGVMADKDFQSMFSKIIPFAKRVFTVTPDNDRALDAGMLAEYFRERGVRSCRLRRT